MNLRFGVLHNPRAVAQMAENMTVEQIAARLNITEDQVEDLLDTEGVKGPGGWTLKCLKTGRQWRCHTERACYRKAQMLGLVEYTFGRTAAAAPLIAAGDVDARIADFLGRKWSLRRIAAEVGMSAPAVHKRIKRMRA